MSGIDSCPGDYNENIIDLCRSGVETEPRNTHVITVRLLKANRRR